MAIPHTLSKSERLKSRKVINTLFTEGQSEFQYPLKCIFFKCSPIDKDLGPLLFAATVSKRNFKRAVKRNLIKRHIREAYRMNKPATNHEKPETSQWALMYIFVSKEQEDIALLPDAMLKINKKILKRISPKP